MRKILFRNGEREVPDHVAELMADLPTHTLTFEQAIKLANESMIRRHLNKVQDDVIKEHAKTWRW